MAEAPAARRSARKDRTMWAAMSVPFRGRPPHWEARKADCRRTSSRERNNWWWCLRTSLLSRMDR